MTAGLKASGRPDLALVVNDGPLQVEGDGDHAPAGPQQAPERPQAGPREGPELRAGRRVDPHDAPERVRDDHPGSGAVGQRRRLGGQAGRHTRGDQGFRQAGAAQRLDAVRGLQHDAVRRHPATQERRLQRQPHPSPVDRLQPQLPGERGGAKQLHRVALVVLGAFFQPDAQVGGESQPDGPRPHQGHVALDHAGGEEQPAVIIGLLVLARAEAGLRIDIGQEGTDGRGLGDDGVARGRAHAAQSDNAPPSRLRRSTSPTTRRVASPSEPDRSI
mgnify:CR=1 FL=1